MQAERNSTAELAYKFALTVQEAVLLTGIGEKTIRQAIRDRALRAKAIGREIHLLPDDLRAWMAALPDVEPAQERPARIVPTQGPRRRV